MKKPESNQLANEWFEKANHDLQDANILFKNAGHSDTICFLCQQAAEKYLKGFLVNNKITPPKIHDLPTLLSKCSKINPDFKDWLEECTILNRYYVETRYPLGMPWKYPRSEIRQAIEYAQSLAKFIKK